MDRTRKLAAFWSWLPAFRAVAETEHLPTASKDLRVTASALSRTIRLLEDEVGQPLFERTGRRLELNDAGRLFTRAVRDAMRVVHEGLLAVEGKAFQGAIHVAVPGPFAPLFVLPALSLLAEQHPRLVVHIHAMRAASVSVALRRGDIDIALLDDPVPSDDLALMRVRELRHDVFVAPGRARPLDELVHVAPVTDPRGTTPDGWPLDQTRRIGLRVTRMQVAIDAVRTGEFAAVLPVDVGIHQALEPLDLSSSMGTTTLYLAHRPSLPVRGRTEVLRDAILKVSRPGNNLPKTKG